MKKFILFVAALALALPASAQQSASYTLAEHALNAGGDPRGGVVLASPSYRISLDALGGSVVGRDMTSESYWMDGGFVFNYPPPGEIQGLRFIDAQTFVWSPEPSADIYNLYRGTLFSILSGQYGICIGPELTEPMFTDTFSPPLGFGIVYLVTSENRLDEEGTKGFQSGGTERGGATCP